MNFGMFKKFNHRTFNYLPRYWDKDKEKLDDIVGRYNKDIDQTELSKRRISTGFTSKKTSNVNSSKYTRQANIRLLIIIAILCYISYEFMMSDKFLKILEALT